MATVRELLREIQELRNREHVWLGIREHLESFTPEGGVESAVEIDGAVVPQDVVLDVISDVDSECLGPIQLRIREIEASKVDNGKAAKKEKAKPARKAEAKRPGKQPAKKRSSKKS